MSSTTDADQLSSSSIESMYVENLMASPGSSANIITTVPESPVSSKAISINSNVESAKTPMQQNGVSYGPVGILWDMENCPVPSDVRPEDVAGNIRMALRVHPVIKGAVTMFSAYGDFNAFPRRLREGCQRTGVKLVDVPNGRKDAADKAILVDMFLFALDNRPPSSILLISGDVDFAPALHILGQRGYTIILVIPSGVGVSSALSNAGRFVWDWPSVARGEGFVPPKASVPRGYDLTGYLMGCNIGDNLDIQDEEEAIVYKGISHTEHSFQTNINQIYCSNSSRVSTELSFVPEHSGSNITTGGAFFASSRSQGLPSALNDASARDQNSTQDQSWWVVPGDIHGLKGQLLRLLEMFGGSLQLVRVPAEYIKLFGRPLYMAEYGVSKLVHLIQRMSDAFTVAGKGHRKLLCVRNSSEANSNKFSTIGFSEETGNRHIKKFPNTPLILKNDSKGKGVIAENMDSGISQNVGSSSDDLSDEEKAACDFDVRLGSFRMEVQELLVCFSVPIPLGSFGTLYEQRYKKTLDCQSFGVNSLEELFERVQDVVEVREDQGTKRKLLISGCVGG